MVERERRTDAAEPASAGADRDRPGDGHAHTNAGVGVAETLVGTGSEAPPAPAPAPAVTTTGAGPAGGPLPEPASATGSVPTGLRASGTSDLAPGAVVGEYRVECLLGEGGMGTVYGAVHPVIGKRAAIKVLKRQRFDDGDAVERFVLEARAVNQIGHPNIVDIFAFGELTDGRSYFVMEWLRGETLGQRMQRGRLAFAECVEILDAVILGLDAAHAKGIIHRDLKPDNVFLTEVRGQRPAIKLLDFGIAKLTGGEEHRLARTRTGALMGTPQYISPEQARGHEIDHRTDIYSLGVMAFELFTGRPPFEADSAMDMIAKHLHDPAPRPSTVVALPLELDRIIHEMLDKAAANRPDLAAVRLVLDDIRTASVDLTLLGTVPDITLPATVRASRARSRTRQAALVGLGVAALAGGWWATHRGAAAARPAQAALLDAGVETATAPTAPPAVPIAPIAPIAPAATGTLELAITGGEPATITIDGEAVAPGRKIRVDRPAGPHELRVLAPGKKPATVQITLIAGQTLTEQLALVGERAGGGGAGRPGRGPGSATTPGPGPGSGAATVVKPPPDDDEGVIHAFPEKP